MLCKNDLFVWSTNSLISLNNQLIAGSIFINCIIMKILYIFLDLTSEEGIDISHCCLKKENKLYKKIVFNFKLETSMSSV